MNITVYTLNAFAKAANGGNPAGVVLDADCLSDYDMQRIAAKVGFSETAFLQKSDKAHLKIRFFTPSAEVNLCGHATIASFYLLAQKGILQVGKYTQETKAGILNVQINHDHVIYMNQSKPHFYEYVDRQEVADSLNIAENIIVKNYPVQIVSTGLKDIFIPISTLEELHSLRPNFSKITKISKKYDVTGYHVFTLKTKYDSTAHCRNFAPLYEIPEEAATGTSSGALSCYLYNYGVISEDTAKHLIFEQGYSMQRPSEILANLVIHNKKITEVLVGGIARDINTIEIKL